MAEPLLPEGDDVKQDVDNEDAQDHVAHLHQDTGKNRTKFDAE